MSLTIYVNLYLNDLNYLHYLNYLIFLDILKLFELFELFEVFSLFLLVNNKLRGLLKEDLLAQGQIKDDL